MSDEELAALYAGRSVSANPGHTSRLREVYRAGQEHPCGDYPAPCNCDDPETHNGH